MNENSHKFINNVSWLIAGRVFQMLLSFVITMITARYLGPSNYGIINYIGSFCALFTPVCTLGFNEIIVKELVDGKDCQGEIIGTMLVLRLVSSLLAIISIVFMVGVLNEGSRLYISIAFFQSFALLFNSLETLNYWYQYRLESKKTTIISSAAFFFMSVYKVFILIMKKSVVWFAASSTLEVFFIAIIVFWQYKKDSGPSLSFSREMIKRLLSKSYNFILSGFMVAMYGQMDKVMLKQLMTETEVGYYSAALSLCNYWPFILSAIIASARPIIMELHNIDVEQYICKLRQLYAAIIWIGFIMAGFISAFAKYLILIVYGEKYLDAIGILRIIAWYTSFAYLGVARSIWLLSEGHQKYEKYLAACGALSNLVLNYIMINAWGAKGAAFATLLTQMLTNFFIPFLFRDLRPNCRLIVEGVIFKNINISYFLSLAKVKSQVIFNSVKKPYI